MRERFHRAPLIGDIVEDADAEDLFVANHRHEQVLAEADRARVREGVAMLPEPYRELIVLRYFEGWQIGDERNPDRDGGDRVTLAKKYDVTPRTIQNWLAKATQTNYAQLARIVLQHGESNDTARLILLEAGREVEIMANALDTSCTLPIALCGGLAAPLRPYMPVSMLKRIVTPQGDSAAGALRLIQQRLKE